jgi:hypothetical protein
MARAAWLFIIIIGAFNVKTTCAFPSKITLICFGWTEKRKGEVSKKMDKRRREMERHRQGRGCVNRHLAEKCQF